MKKWLSALLALAMVFTLLPGRAMGAGDAEESTRRFGHVSSGNEYTYPTVEQARTVLPVFKRGTLPSSYDGRQYVTPVKDQGSNGTCWAFGTTGALEANMKINGMGEYDFSERHLAYSASTYRYNGQIVNRDQGFGFLNGWWGSTFDTIQEGGNREMASAYFMRGTSMSGAVLESEDPYVSYERANRNPAITESKHKVFSARDIMYLTGSNKATDSEFELIKNAIMTYGALDSSMHANDPYSGEYDSQYFNERYAAFYYDGNSGPNHEVLLVGWDDNFSRSKFPKRPSRDGAWLVKNSWGTGWGDKGYFWISYDDTQYPIETSVFFGSDAWTSDDYMYETDYTAVGDSNERSPATDYAKVFPITAEDHEIRSVRFFVPEGGSVTASVDVIPSFTDWDGYTFSAKGQRTVAYPGWYTVDLDAPVRLAASGEFAVVLHLDGASSLVYDSNSSNSAKGSYWMRNGVMVESTNNWALKAIAHTSTQDPPVNLTPAIESGTVAALGKLTAKVTAPSGSRIIIASYENGRLLEARSLDFDSDHFSEDMTFYPAIGDSYSLMLMDGKTFAPLCAAWSGK